MTPEQFPNRILIAVTGMSPQILTETLFALSQQQPAFVPTEVHLVSTAEGARHARLSLLEGDRHFFKLCEDYGLDAAIFSNDRIHAITDADGNPLDDIRSVADNEAAADFITDMIRTHTTRDDAAVHVSMAGGRKTMGYYAGYALSLYGRDQDRLSHVLVSEGYEGHREFFYPTPRSHAIYRTGSTALDAAEAKVELANIPFVRLRDELPEKIRTANSLLGGKQSFSAAIAAAELGRTPQRMLLDLPNLRFEIDGQPLEGIGAAPLSLLCWMVQRQMRGEGNLARSDIQDEEKGKALGKEYARFCRRLDTHANKLAVNDGDSTGKQRLPELLKVINALNSKGFASLNDFDYRRSNLKKALRDCLGERLAEQFIPRNVGNRTQANYSFIDIEEHFEFVPLD